MKTLLLTPFLLLFLLTACTSEKKNDFVEFSDLSTADSLRWQEKLMDAIHAEMVDSVMHVKNNIEYSVNYCGAWMHMRIQISDDQVTVVEKPNADVKKAVFAYYMTNRNKHDARNDKPNYSYSSLKEIQSNIVDAKKALAQVKKQTNDSSMIDYHRMYVQEWETLLRAMKVLEIDEIPQIEYAARIEVLGRHQNPDTKKRVFKEIAESYFELREKLAQEYFGKSYLELYYLVQQRKKQIDRERMAALRILLPMRVVDIEYCLKHDCCQGYAVPQVELEGPPPVLDLPYERLAEPEIEIMEEIEGAPEQL